MTMTTMTMLVLLQLHCPLSSPHKRHIQQVGICVCALWIGWKSLAKKSQPKARNRIRERLLRKLCSQQRCVACVPQSACICVCVCAFVLAKIVARKIELQLQQW